MPLNVPSDWQVIVSSPESSYPLSQVNVTDASTTTVASLGDGVACTIDGTVHEVAAKQSHIN